MHSLTAQMQSRAYKPLRLRFEVVLNRVIHSLVNPLEVWTGKCNLRYIIGGLSSYYGGPTTARPCS